MKERGRGRRERESQRGETHINVGRRRGGTREGREKGSEMKGREKKERQREKAYIHWLTSQMVRKAKIEPS